VEMRIAQSSAEFSFWLFQGRLFYARIGAILMTKVSGFNQGQMKKLIRLAAIIVYASIFSFIFFNTCVAPLYWAYVPKIATTSCIQDFQSAVSTTNGVERLKVSGDAMFTGSLVTPAELEVKEDGKFICMILHMRNSGPSGFPDKRKFFKEIELNKQTDFVFWGKYERLIWARDPSILQDVPPRELFVFRQSFGGRTDSSYWVNITGSRGWGELAVVGYKVDINGNRGLLRLVGLKQSVLPIKYAFDDNFDWKVQIPSQVTELAFQSTAKD
jgi:hypothetical protein